MLALLKQRKKLSRKMWRWGWRSETPCSRQEIAPRQAQVVGRRPVERQGRLVVELCPGAVECRRGYLPSFVSLPKKKNQTPPPPHPGGVMAKEEEKLTPSDSAGADD